MNISATDINLLIGIFMPLLIEIIKQKRLPDWTNGIIVVLSCVAAAVLSVWAAGQLDNLTSYVQAIVIILPAAVIAYNQFWKPVLGGTDTEPTVLNKITNL